jgi:tRNA-dihydrouridine synthase A
MLPEPHRLSIAPMMDRTDRHLRFVMRQLSRRTLLYTEMITTGALIHGDAARHLAYHPDEHPVALQLGGDDPAALAVCARMAEDAGYDEVDLNVGCPSDRVQKGRFGAILMKTPEVVADAVAAMRAACGLPITVKHRIGVDDLDRYEDMARFVSVVAPAGPARFTVHARKAWLQGLSPKQNRNVPPLRYDEVHRLKVDFPDLSIEINGGIRTLDEALHHLDHVDAVMIGRAAVDDPYLFAEADRRIYGETAPVPTRESILPAVAEYTARHVADGGRIHHVFRHLVHLYKGQPGARAWRQALTRISQASEPDPFAIMDLPVRDPRGAPASTA